MDKVFAQLQNMDQNQNVHLLSFTGLDHDSHYIMIGKNVKFNATDKIEVGFLNSAGNVLGNGNGEYHERTAKYNETYYISGGSGGSSAAYGYPTNSYHFRPQSYSGALGGFLMEFNTDNYMSAMHYRVSHSWYDLTNYSGCGEMWCSMSSTDRIEGIKLDTVSGNQFIQPTQIMLYKYVD